MWQRARASYRIIIHSNVSLISAKVRLSREDELSLLEVLQAGEATRMESFYSFLKQYYTYIIKFIYCRKRAIYEYTKNLYYKLII